MWQLPIFLALYGDLFSTLASKVLHFGKHGLKMLVNLQKYTQNINLTSWLMRKMRLELQQVNDFDERPFLSNCFQLWSASINDAFYWLFCILCAFLAPMLRQQRLIALKRLRKLGKMIFSGIEVFCHWLCFKGHGKTIKRVKHAIVSFKTTTTNDAHCIVKNHYFCVFK